MGGASGSATKRDAKTAGPFMGDETREELIKILLDAFPKEGGAKIGDVLEKIRQLMEKDRERACWMRRRLIKRACESKN